MRKAVLFTVLFLTVLFLIPGTGAFAAARVDLKGRTIVISDWWQKEGPFSGTDETTDRVQLRLAVEKKYNCKIVVKPVVYDDLVAQITASVMAGTPIADIIAIDTNKFQSLHSKGFLQPWTAEAKVKDKAWDAITAAFMTRDGKCYGLMSDRYYPRAVWYFNKTLFQREGLPDPYDLFFRGQWTWDKMLEIAKKATKDTNGDGVIEQWGLVDGGWDFREGMIYSNGGELVKLVNGKPVFSANSPAAIEALTFFQDLGLKHKVMQTKPPENPSWDWHGQMFREGKIAMYPSNFWYIDVFTGAKMQDKWGVVLFPKGPRAKDYSSYGGGSNGYSILKGVKDPKYVSMVWNDLAGPGAYEYMQAATGRTQEEETMAVYMAKFTDTKSWDVLNYLWNKNLSVLGFLGAYPDANKLWGEAMTGIATGAKTPVVAIQEKAQAIQAALDEAASK